MSAEPSLGWLISVDDHILEPPNLWVDRVSAKDRDRAPHMETIGGTEFWLYDNKRFPTVGLSAVAGKSREEFSPEPLPYSEMRPGCYDPVARLDDMDQAGILASMCFPTITRFCGQLFMDASDREGFEFGFECLQHYNDWLVEEWCGAAPWSLHPPDADPDVGPAPGRQGDGEDGGQGCKRIRLLREHRTARSAHHPRPRRLLESSDVGCERLGHGGVHACRVVLDAASDHQGCTVHGQPGLGCDPHVGNNVDLQRHVPAVSRTSRSRCPRARWDGYRSSSSGPSRC